MSAAEPRTARGALTKRKLIEAAEDVFSRVGYSDASISRITEAAGIGQGTFYLYFDSKLQIFNELVEDLNHRVRQAMSAASASTTNRLDSERAGFRAFFQFTADHPALYRVVREAEFVSPGALRMHYSRIVEGYIAGLRAAGQAGEISDIDPTVAAWALMGVGEMIGMRWVLWGDPTTADAQSGSDADPFASGTRQVPEHVFEQMMRFIEGALGRPAASVGSPGATSVTASDENRGTDD
ncbi:TetR/AcrR family transcriptional regulator [Cryobacterium psychrophilum]|uniref:TetR/AcrR family transcriptional regulator n=1 Tax=Cryobacterium psychrophilum TaxID=41988 RepID=A0A4Y8KNK8_9MICO|nr:TetR/AcrR family transcriptional regulator [Cryobacterium psychrophilum]TDW29130.1 TetR family transcriptional regulator [Cryobacterium psychrophilum]TFD77794.1 TetR/AcrR family transcriptional regulator [Cryobacterium psychrophilum]